MKSLDKKLWRELWQMRMQALAIALVILGGVSIYVMSSSTLLSLQVTREQYYRGNRFADVFVSLKRAPLSVLKDIEAIPGVDKVEARVIAYVNVDVEGFRDPISAHLVSLPEENRGLLNQIYLRSGRLLSAGRDNEVLLSEKFANAHGLREGDVLYATINGRRKALTVVGVALSPEYIYQIAPGAVFPDDKRYGVMWMAHKPLASAYNMDGAFNNVALTLSRGTNAQDVIDRLDDLLKPYGGIGAYARKDQLSNRFLTEEMKQQRTIATVFPTIFFGVAAFLLNVVISRLISLEREQIAVLKGFGYSNMAIGWHYTKLVLLITGLGIAGGIAAGIFMGKALSNIYMMLFSFPYLTYVVSPKTILGASWICMLVAVLGTAYALRSAASLPPAEAMRPTITSVYRETLLERMGLKRWFSQSKRMILRHIERKLFNSFLTILGISMAYGTMMVGGFQKGSIDHMTKVQFSMSQREDLIANLTEPTSQRALYSLRNIEGVKFVEGYRNVPVRLRFEHRSYRTTVDGFLDNAKLHRLLDSDLKKIDLPHEGVILTDYLAKLLRIKPGEMLTIEVLQYNHAVVQVPMVGVTKEYLGANAYMNLDALNRLLDEGEVISRVALAVDKRRQRDVYAKLKEMPRIAGVVEQDSAIDAFYATFAETILFYNFVATLLGSCIVFGVVYNSMRIALSERSRELASLRVLGFRRSEVAYLLLGEMGLLTLLALPPGMWVGYSLCLYLTHQFESDLYRIPLIIHPNVYAFATAVVIGSAILSALMIWRQLSNLDMVAALKTKE